MPLRTVNAATLKQWLDNQEAVLLDVREPAEYEAESIAGSTLRPLSGISKASLPDCSGKKLVIHCRKGGRGTSACEKLLAEDPTLEIFNLEGGIASWAEAGYPLRSSGGFFLPLDRQVQLTIGLMLMLGSLLGYFLSPLFFLLTGFLGMGLTLAGLTGFCGLALLMAKMPWNQACTR
ncbi:MAG: rhodanese-like domain-containing protein [Alphaproteobacteria bacterium]|nr:rhodanese-like domain-containing protein [Alphaproteobacteria bacterium]